MKLPSGGPKFVTNKFKLAIAQRAAISNRNRGGANGDLAGKPPLAGAQRGNNYMEELGPVLNKKSYRE